MAALAVWLKASRLASQSYIALPLILGQVIHCHQTGELSWTVFALVQLFGLADQLYIVWANDYADREIDPLNQTATPFSGGSRVLVDGDLRPGQLLTAAIAAAATCVAIALGLGLGWDRWLAAPLVVIALGLLWAYSFGPIRLNYRGGGELLQMVGVAGVLPLFGYYAQAGTLASFPWALLVVLLPTHLACAIGTALPDEPSDRLSNKRTAVVLLGPRGARLAILALNALSIAAFTRVGLVPPELLTVAAYLAVPTLATLAQVPLLGSAPGSRQILAHVSLAILVTLSLVVATATALVRA